MKRGYLYLVSLAAAVLLAGCVPPSQPRPTTPPPQSTPTTTSSAQQAKPAPAAPQTAQQPRVDFHLAQGTQGKGLKELKLPNGTIWYLPEPVLTRADLSNVQSEHTSKGQAFVRFTFNKQGAGKLANITNRYKGRLLVLTVNGSLARIMQIAGPVNNGVLDVGYPSQQQADTLVNAIAGK